MGRTPPGQTRNRIFHFVRDRILKGLPPTVREVAEVFDFRSAQTAREHLDTLVREGRLVQKKGKARGYQLPDTNGQAGATRLIPLLGRVPAGSLELATEDLEGYIPVQTRPAASGDLFGLRVHGNSMQNAGILPGDIVVVRRQAAADTGDIVVALVGDEATVKRLRIRGNRPELHPENPDYQPIIPDAAELSILGKVIEVRRYLDP